MLKSTRKNEARGRVIDSLHQEATMWMVVISRVGIILAIRELEVAIVESLRVRV